MVPILTEKQRNEQIRKEQKISIILYVVFVLWLLITGYGLGLGDPESFVTIMGLPLWFVLSCIVGPLWFCIASWLVVKYKFKDFDLDKVADEETVVVAEAVAAAAVVAETIAAEAVTEAATEAEAVATEVAAETVTEAATEAEAVATEVAAETVTEAATETKGGGAR